LVGNDGTVLILDNLSAIKGDEPLDLPPLGNIMFVKGDIRNDIEMLFSKYGLIGAGVGSLFVFKGSYKAVLINYPNEEEKEKILLNYYKTQANQ